MTAGLLYWLFILLASENELNDSFGILVHYLNFLKCKVTVWWIQFTISVLCWSENLCQVPMCAKQLSSEMSLINLATIIRSIFDMSYNIISQDIWLPWDVISVSFNLLHPLFPLTAHWRKATKWLTRHLIPLRCHWCELQPPSPPAPNCWIFEAFGASGTPLGNPEWRFTLALIGTV